MRRTLAMLLCCACGKEQPTDQAFGVVDPGEFPDAGLGSLEPTYGFYDGRRAEFYHFGDVDVRLNAAGDLQGAAANPMYWFYRGDKPLFEMEADPGHPGGYRLTTAEAIGTDPPTGSCQSDQLGQSCQSQYPIVDYLPGRDDYSPYWEIVKVKVPDDYEINAIKSTKTLREAVDTGAFQLVYTGDAIHCPIVDSEAELQQGVSNRDRAFPRVPLWFRRLKSYCFLFERPDGFLGGDGFEMPAARVQVGTSNDPEVDHDVLSVPGMLLYFPRTHVVYPTGAEYDAFPPDGILTGSLPGDPGYSPLAVVYYYRVVPGFPFGGYTSLSDIDPSLAEQADPKLYRDYPARGTIAPCTVDADCDDGLTPPLACNQESGYCDAPPVGFAQHCGPGIARCDHTEYPATQYPGLFPMGLACTSLRIQTERFCYMRCRWQDDDMDPGPNDSRCQSIPGMICARTLRVIEKDAGVCLRECNALRGIPESAAANAECEMTQDEPEYKAALDGVIYGAQSRLVPIPFDLDDNPFVESKKDDPEPDGRVDLFEGTTCLTTSRDLCAWPDSRADALRRAGQP
jgi:hypothetical protein